MVAVLKVDRSPVTREWNSAGGNRKGSDQAIWIESADSVGFSMGVSCTAFIKEEEARWRSVIRSANVTLE